MLKPKSQRIQQFDKKDAGFEREKIAKKRGQSKLPEKRQPPSARRENLLN